jgi:hypothetical protein
VLNQAEEACWTVLSLTARNGSVTQFRDAAMSLTSILAFQINLGKNLKSAPYVVSALLGEAPLVLTVPLDLLTPWLDLACSTTLGRELLEVHRPETPGPVTHDDLLWPSMDEKARPHRRGSNPRPTILRFDDTADDEPEGPRNADLLDFSARSLPCSHC